MMGIIAVIIAVIKGHTTFAVCMGIWTIIAFALYSSEYSQFAIGPGVLFVIWALSMKNLRKANASNKTEEKEPVSAKTNAEILEESNKPAVCEKCGAELSPEWSFCNNCGYPVRKAQELSYENTNTLSYNDEHIADVSANSILRLPSETNINIDANDNNSEKSILNLELNRLPLKLRRAFRLVEDEEWEKASEYFESILDEDPENAYAYLGKAMIKAHVSSPENISTEEICAICKLRSFFRAEKFADEELSRIIDNWKAVGSE